VIFVGVVRKSITIPEDVYNKAKMLSDNFSSVVIVALREYLRKVEIDKAKNAVTVGKIGEEMVLVWLTK